MYKLDNDFATGHYGVPVSVMVVGCGGTGGFVAESLCRLLPAKFQLILVDPDRVEERNLVRQNFFREDIGKVKSEALALRLSRNYGRPVAYSTYPVAMTHVQGPGIVVGCVDNGLARRDIAARFKQHHGAWWIDAGNGENYGQVLIGNSDIGYFQEDKSLCVALPLPTIQKPELLAQKAAAPQLACEQLPEQGPTINLVMAALVVEVVRRLIAGTCSWMQLYLDMETGTLHPVMAEPEEVKKIVGPKKVQLSSGAK